MGSGRWSADDWKSYSSTHIDNASATTGSRGIYKSSKLDATLDPKNLKNAVRESRDSVDNPFSTPIIVGLDVTGSMSRLLDYIAREGLPKLAAEIYDRKPVQDPHVMFMGIGDAVCDTAPLQATQFEADIKIAQELTKIWLEGGGGGNNFEGYALAWYFAAQHTSIDSMEKRGEKGYLFTIGDDGPTTSLTKAQAQRFFGDTLERDLTGEELLTMASRKYEVFHLCLENGGSSSESVTKRWKDLLGERAISVSDHTKIGEIIVSLLQVLAGVDKKAVVDSWDGTTSLVVNQAIKDLNTTGGNASGGLVKF